MFLVGKRTISAIIKTLFLIATIVINNQSIAQTVPLSKNAQVSILTVGTSDESYALYGHTGIRFKDSISNIDIVFNYGAFDFETENFMLKFVKGDLQYFVSSSSYIDFEYNYRYENRSIYEQPLNLPPEKIKALFSKIYNSTLTNERFYTYKFIDKNCTVLIIEKINEVLGEVVIDFQKPKQESYRSVLFPYTNNHFFQQLGINIIFGLKVDAKAKKMFLPLDLMNELKSTYYKGKPIVIETKTIYKAQKKPTPFPLFDNIYILITLLTIVVVLKNNAINLGYFFVLGLLGLFFSVIGFYSLHQEVLWNYNILLFNPFYLILLYFFYQKNYTKTKRVLEFLAFCLVVYVFVISTKVYIISILPIIVATFILLYQFRKQMIFKISN
ncbi:MAG TPA: hypothetical protein DDZ41_09060 [Flavobacterium sp.]|nr:hypothetical protein [Flavobacterium sp.]